MSVTPIVALRDSRLNKKKALERLGVNPYPSGANRTHDAGVVVNSYSEYEGTTVTVSGRLMSLRKQGGLIFGHVQDETGTIQLFIRRDTVAPTDPTSGAIGFADLTYIDVGDIVEATGVITKTKVGEISVLVHRFRLLTKSLRPLPEKWSGLKDRELILRKRYLDTTAAPQNKERFASISRMLWAIRAFLHERGFHEFITPVLQPQYGGGTAKPFRTHVNALDLDTYLAISHELYLKRLIIAGYDKVYTIGKYFRNEGIDRSHHPEFSMVETMTAYKDYTYNMELIESMFKRVAQEAFGRTEFQVRGHQISFSEPWKRVSMSDAVKETTGVDFREFHNVTESNAALIGLGLAEQPTVGHGLVHAFESRVERELVHPTLVYGHPVEISPLAKPSAADPRFAERFEIFIAGMECGDNWSEQNDPIEQLAFWRRSRSTTTDESELHPLDYDFLEALEYGMPPTTGIGPGLERMAMIFTGEENIDDVIFFPLMRPVTSPANREIYDVSEADVQAKPNAEIVLSFDDFEKLVRSGALKPESNTVIVRPSLQTWRSSSLSNRWIASGQVRLDGLLRNRSILLTGYSESLEGEASIDRVNRRFSAFIDGTIAPALRASCTDVTFNVLTAASPEI